VGREAIAEVERRRAAGVRDVAEGTCPVHVTEWLDVAALEADLEGVVGGASFRLDHVGRRRWRDRNVIDSGNSLDLLLLDLLFLDLANDHDLLFRGAFGGRGPRLDSLVFDGGLRVAGARHVVLVRLPRGVGSRSEHEANDPDYGYSF